MSRRLPSSQRPHIHQPSLDNPYQNSLVTPVPPKNLRKSSGGSVRTYNNVAVYDTGLSEATCTEVNSYCPYQYGYQTGRQRETGNRDCIFSDDSASTQLPYYEIDDISVQRFSRRSLQRKGNCNNFAYGNESQTRNVYPNRNRSSSIRVPHGSTLPFRAQISRSSDRPQSSLSSGVGSAIVDGCGGHCQTFENVCYYFLQVAFTMGVLIGTSLCIAGAVLRKSAAKNLQVLVYIGALLSLVSGLLLAIQCSARYNARKRRKAIRNAKRGAPIPLDTLYNRTAPLHQPLIGGNQRSIPTVHVQLQSRNEDLGMPWWRRKDLV